MTQNSQTSLEAQPSVTFSSVAKNMYKISSARTKAYTAAALASTVMAVKEVADFQIAFAERFTDWFNGAETVANSNLGVSGSLAVGFMIAAGYLGRQTGLSFNQDVAKEAVKRAQERSAELAPKR